MSLSLKLPCSKSSQHICLIPTIILFESSTLIICETWKAATELDLGTDMDAAKDYVSNRFSESDSRIIYLRFLRGYGPIVLGSYIEIFNHFFGIINPQSEIKIEFWDYYE